MLDYDEDLLMYANALSDKAYALQQEYAGGELMYSGAHFMLTKKSD